MSKYNALFGLCISSLCVFLHAARAETRFLADVNGERYMSVIRSSHVQTAPSWNPAQGSTPPLNISEAFGMARKELLSFFDNNLDQANSWIVNDFQIMRLESWRRQNKWCYVVNFSHNENRNIFPIVVLFDGTVIHPEIYREKGTTKSKSQHSTKR